MEKRPVKSFANGRYEGEWKPGTVEGEEGDIRHGRGILVDDLTGHIFEGYFKDNRVVGKGRYIRPSGDVYVGQFNGNQAHGYGKFSLIWVTLISFGGGLIV